MVNKTYVVVCTSGVGEIIGNWKLGQNNCYKVL